MNLSSTNPSRKENLSLRPFVLALILILVVIGIYIVKKDYKNKKNLAETENRKIENQSKKEESQNLIGLDIVPPDTVNAAINNNEYQIIDIRPTTLFNFSHIESSVNLPLPGENYQKILNKDKKIIIIDEKETNEGKLFVKKLSEADYKTSYLEKGLQNYAQHNFSLISVGDINSDQDKSKVRFINAKEAQERLKGGEKFNFLDVRSKNDYQQYHIEDSTNIPLEQLEKNKKNIPHGKIIIVDKNYIRSFQAAVRLYDMHILGVYCLSESLEELEKQNPPQEE